MCGLISLVSYVDNNLEESLVFVYYGSVVNNRPKNADRDVSNNYHEPGHSIFYKTACDTDQHTYPFRADQALLST